MNLSERKIKRIILLSAFLIFSIAACNGHNNRDGHYGTFKKWNTNALNVTGEKKITRDEFEDQVSKSGFFKKWDTNGNGSLSREEWNKGVKTYFPSFNPIDYGVFNAWDENHDGVVEQGEFDDGLFRVVDHDGSTAISKYEFKHWFSWWPWFDENS